MFIADVLPRHTLRASLLWPWLIQWLAGFSLKAAAQKLASPFALETVYRLRRTLRRELGRLRTLLYREQGPAGSEQAEASVAPQPRWSREQIRAARLAPLAPLLQNRRLTLLERQGGNFILPAFPGLIVKDSYWRWPERNLAGNAIDFFTRVLGLSFHEAMRQITSP